MINHKITKCTFTEYHKICQLSQVMAVFGKEKILKTKATGDENIVK